MERRYPHLCSPITLGGITFRNRMFSAPTSGTDITADRCIGPKTTAYYELKAKGGAAAVTMSPVKVHPETDGSAQSFRLDLAVTGSLASFTYTADAIKRHGAVPSMLLSHGGQFAGAYMTDKKKLAEMKQYGPVDCVRYDGVPVKGLTHGQIADIVRSYGETAALAKRAGFQMVTVHGGHGWLINQFFSPYFNKRTDEYGGCIENRVRLAREVLTSIRDAVGKNFPIEIRISGYEGIEGGYEIDEACRIAAAIEDLVDLIHVSAGSHRLGFHITHPSMFQEHGCNVYLAAEVKKHVHVPVATLGAINDPAMMEEIIASGKADIIEMGRELLADPYLPSKVMANHPEDIVKCLRCFTCMSERVNTSTRRCAVNPMIGHELEGMEIVPVRKPKRVLVAGGGVGGMEAAVTAARRGHKVTLCEKSGELGGILKSEQAIPFKREMYELGINLARQLKEEGVTICLNTEVTPTYAQRMEPDALIVAVGSEPFIPPIPGIGGENVVLVNDYYLKREQVGDTVAILGGGLSGCECAVHLAREGKQVHLVGRRSEAAADANVRHRPALLRELNAQGVTLHTGCTGLQITAEGILCRDQGGNEYLVPGKTVICAVGQRPCRAAADALLDAAPIVRLIGDCVQPANITTAIYEGYHAALDL